MDFSVDDFPLKKKAPPKLQTEFEQNGTESRLQIVPNGRQVRGQLITDDAFG